MPVTEQLIQDSPAEENAAAYCASLVRRYDRDRYLTALFAPALRRGDLLALYAFNHEIAKTRETVSEPMIGRIRLQWWRETLDGIAAGTVREHPVAAALADAIAARHLPRPLFDRLIDAREADLDDDPPRDTEALLAYAEATSSALMDLAAAALGGEASAATRPGGIAYALTGLIRSVPFHLSRRRCYLPRDLLERHGVSDAALYRARPDIAPVVADLVALARQHLAVAREAARLSPAEVRPALLPLTLAGATLSRIEKAGFDVFAGNTEIGPLGKQLRLIAAALRRRV